jgi:hypothetical protein
LHQFRLAALDMMPFQESSASRGFAGIFCDFFTA